MKIKRLLNRIINIVFIFILICSSTININASDIIDNITITSESVDNNIDTTEILETKTDTDTQFDADNYNEIFDTEEDQDNSIQNQPTEINSDNIIYDETININTSEDITVGVEEIIETHEDETPNSDENIDSIGIIATDFEENIDKTDELIEENTFIDADNEEEIIEETEETIIEDILLSDSNSLYTITYILNGGQNHIDNVTTIDPDIKFVLKNPQREGYTFAGWYNKLTNERVYNVCNTNITIFAKWNPITYIVTLVPNGGKYDITTTNTIKYTNISPKILLPVPTRKYYTFGGWYKDKSYTQKIEYIYSGSIGNMTLYAKWNHITHNIKYYMNETSTDPVTLGAKHVTSYKEATGAKLAAPSRKGFVFNGYYETNPNSINFTSKEKKITSIPKYSSTDKVLYAKWTENKYNLSYNANGSSFTAPMPSISLKYTDNTRTPVFTSLKERKGYIFLGWNTKKDGSGKNYGENVTISRLSSKNGAKVTLYANWKAIEYGIYCDYRGGNMFNSKGYPLNPRYHTVEKSIKLKNPTKKGYIFEGWYKTKDCTGKKSTVIPKSASEENFYASWSPIKYSIQFNANGGTGKVSSIKGCEYDQSYIIKENLFTKKIRSKTYSFKEWNTKPDGTGKSYMPGDVVSNLTSKNKGKIVLYAIWIKD